MNRLAMSLRYLPVILALGLAACDRPAATDLEPPLAGASIGGAFELTGSDGNTVRWDDFAGRYRVVYFGFTYCPDVCPTDLQRLSKGLELFTEEEPAKGAEIAPIFISVDPERDTPERMGKYAAAFSDRLIGLTGTPEQIKQVAAEYGVAYGRGEDTPDGGYLVNHSTIAYLFGPEGEPIATLPTDRGPQAVAEELRRWVR